MSDEPVPEKLKELAPELLETLQYVLDAHLYDGAMTLGDACLSPAIQNRIERVILKAACE